MHESILPTFEVILKAKTIFSLLLIFEQFLYLEHLKKGTKGYIMVNIKSEKSFCFNLHMFLRDYYCRNIFVITFFLIRICGPPNNKHLVVREVQNVGDH